MTDMTTPPLPPALRRTLTVIRVYGVVSSLAIVLLVYMAIRTPERSSFEEIDVRRINVLNESDLPALVISGQGRLPGPTADGREYAQELSGGRTTASGMIFFNEKGDEVGGLTYQGQRTEDGFTSYGGITFDQFEQDQVVSLQYSGGTSASGGAPDSGVERSHSAGVHVWDRSPDVSIAELLELVDARRVATGATRDSLDAVVAELRAGGLSAHRIFLGSRNRTATLTLEDTSGRPRIRMYVDSTDVARLEFLDESGAVVRAFPE